MYRKRFPGRVQSRCESAKARRIDEINRYHGGVKKYLETPEGDDAKAKRVRAEHKNEIKALKLKVN